MKLRVKTLLIVATTLVLLVAILNAVSRLVLLAGFAEVERNDAERNLRRVVDAFGEAVENLNVKAADWAKWDDTYRYVGDWNSDYVESNLTDESLAELKLNLMLFFDTTGQIAYGRYCDLETGLGRPVAEEDLAAVTGDTVLMRHTTVGSVVAGVVQLPGGTMNIVSRPILTSIGAGPIAGTLIFGRYIDADEVERIGQVTHLSSAVYPCGGVPLPPDVAAAAALLTDRHPRHIHPLDDSRIAGYARISDIHGCPALLLRVDIPRDIYRQGRVTVGYLIVAIIAVGLLFGAIMLILLQKTVLSRVAKLSDDVNAIAVNGDNSARVSLDGNDELAGLGTSVNGMLASLARVEAEIRGRNREMGMIMSTVPAGLLSIDERFRINPEHSASAQRILGVADLAGRDFFEAIGLVPQRTDEASLLREYLELVLREPLSEREMAGLNPFEELCMKRDGGRETWVRLRFYIMRREDGRKNHLLVVIEDITEAKALAEKVQSSESEITKLRAIAEDPDCFRDFLVEINAGIARARERLGEMAASDDKRALVNDVFRDVHTMKGAADVFGLGAVVAIAAQLEETIGAFRTAAAVTDGQLRIAGESVDDLQAAVRHVEEGVRQILGDDYGERPDFHIRIPLEKLNEESRAILDCIEKATVSDGPSRLLHREICMRLQSLREIPARRALARALKLAPRLLVKFEKDIRFEFEGAELPVDYNIARELVGPLIHLLRNAVDHGIEFPEERAATGKTGPGMVRVVVRKTEFGIHVQVVDNGRGLDPVKLRKTAVEKGMITEAAATQLSDDDARRLIFRPGFTTTETATDISGRGVGMDAVYMAIERLRGTIAIDSRVGCGTTITLCVPYGEC